MCSSIHSFTDVAKVFILLALVQPHHIMVFKTKAKSIGQRKRRQEAQMIRLQGGQRQVARQRQTEVRRYGCVFVGKFIDKKIYGQGSMACANGDVYVEKWQDDNRNGNTCMLQTAMSNDGEWKRCLNIA